MYTGDARAVIKRGPVRYAVHRQSDSSSREGGTLNDDALSQNAATCEQSSEIGRIVVKLYRVNEVSWFRLTVSLRTDGYYGHWRSVCRSELSGSLCPRTFHSNIECCARSLGDSIARFL